MIDHQNTMNDTPRDTTDCDNFDYSNNVPIIDLSNPDRNDLIQQISNACSTIGFFHIINHGISSELIQQLKYQCQQYFTQFPSNKKVKYQRNENNSRGYFDNELTKQRRDWKYALDVGIPGSRSWLVPDNDTLNNCLDGYNQLPSHEELHDFRTTIASYFDECAKVAHQLTILMTEGIISMYNKKCIAHGPTDNSTNGTPTISQLGEDMIYDLYQNHTSYLRLNYYPPCPPDVANEEASDHDGIPLLGISPHRDAGFVTILLQDDECYSLQVPKRLFHNHLQNDNNTCTTDDNDNEWCTVKPIVGGLTINTGDMAQIWSNGYYKAPLHRVLTHPNQERYSSPFFYNPGYATYIQPIVGTISTSSGCQNQYDIHIRRNNQNKDTDDSFHHHKSIQYHPCLWGYYRAVRFAGDLTDLGVEIQVEDYHINSSSKHIMKQSIFEQHANFKESFSVERYRTLLE